MADKSPAEQERQRRIHTISRVMIEWFERYPGQVSYGPRPGRDLAKEIEAALSEDALKERP